jgi:hypothetical protein
MTLFTLVMPERIRLPLVTLYFRIREAPGPDLGRPQVVPDHADGFDQYRAPAGPPRAELMGHVLLLALLAALNPTLLAATTVMLLLEHPVRLMFGYWLGAMLMSVTLGCVIVFAIEGSDVVNTTKNTVSPAANFALAIVMFVLAAVLASGGRRRGETGERRRKAKRKEDKGPPKWQQQLSKGSARTTFVIGAVLSLPGATYIIALSDINKQHYPGAVVVLVVILFNLIQLLLLEVPMVAFKVAPTQTPIAIERAKEAARLHWRSYAAWALVVVGVLLAIKGVVELL